MVQFDQLYWCVSIDISQSLALRRGRENDYVINLDGQHKMFQDSMLRKCLVRKTVDDGLMIGCGCRHLEIATGWMAENGSLEKPGTCEERSDDIKYCPLRATQTWEDVKAIKAPHLAHFSLNSYIFIIFEVCSKSPLYKDVKTPKNTIYT